MTEIPLFFPGPAASLFGVFHESAGRSTRQPFVFCHPFGEEKLWAHRVFVTFARQLAAAGHPVLRFDYMANGDSDGEFQDFSVQTALADIGCAINLLKTRTSAARVGLLGLRLGATFAAHTAAARTDVATLILWAPILDGARYMQKQLRVNVATQMAAYKEIRTDREALTAELRAGQLVSVDGFSIGLALFDQMSALTLTGGVDPFAGPCLITQIDRHDQMPVAGDLEALRTLYPHATLQQVREEPFWKEIAPFYDTAPNLASTTLAWLQRP